ncbi:MAG: methylene-tetrahydromethanopterin dehydrogenase N-terminal domain-containing protein [Candidatus Hermodarchaeota archaeon]
MEVLELKPLKKKYLKLVLIESEFPIDWWFEGPAEKKHDLAWNLHLISKEYLDLIKNLIDKYHPDFAVEEKGSRWDEVISEEDPIAVLFNEYKIPYRKIDISENAENYLNANFDESRSLIKQLKSFIGNYMESGKISPEKDYKFQRALLWKQYLQQEYNEQENEVRFKVREAWMMMKIMEIARNYNSKNIVAFHICDVRHFDGIRQYSEELGVDIMEIKIKREAQFANHIENPSIRNILDKSIINLTPLKIKKKEKQEKICYLFDTDENASPFDINMAYDAGFDIVVPISKLTAEQVPKLVQDAIFSRKPGAPTSFFIGGSNVNEGEKIAKKVISSLVPPFECPIIIDYRGSHTTASSIVAKTIEFAKEHKIEDLEGKKVVILGAGPVARIAALLSAKLKSRTYIVETWNKSSKKFIKDLAKELSDKSGTEGGSIEGVFAIEEDQIFEVVEDADIIWCLAAVGVQILSKEVMIKLKNKLVVDINLVPPYGIEGLKPKDNNKEIYPTIFGIGALAIGRLKSEVESSILKEAADTKGKIIFDYKYAFEKAKKIVFREEIKISH